jgi:hypothetical protein
MVEDVEKSEIKAEDAQPRKTKTKERKSKKPKKQIIRKQKSTTIVKTN